MTYHNAIKLMRTACLVAVVCISGCLGSPIVTGQARSPISPSAVRVYLNEEPPAQYEELGIVETWGEDTEFGSSAEDVMIQKLRRLAAKIGANGVIELEIWYEAPFLRLRAVGKGMAVYVPTDTAGR